MASPYAVAIAAFLQIVLRVSFFVEQSSDMCSTAPTLASWIFLISFLGVLLDICIYPMRYMHLPYICQFLGETIVTVLLTEFGSLVVWCSIERNTCKLCKYMLLLMGMPRDLYNAWEKYILGVATTSTSLVILWVAVQATDHIHFLRRRSLRWCRKINSKLWENWPKLRPQTVIRKCVINSDAVGLSNGSPEDSYDVSNEIFCEAPTKRKSRTRSRTRKSRSRTHNHR